MSIRPDRKRKERTLEEKAVWAAYMRDYWKQRPEAYAAMIAKQKAKKTSTKTYRRNKDKPEFRAKRKTAGAKDWAKHRIKRANAAGARHHGLTVEEYLRRKEGDCDICGGRTERGGHGGWMHIDHCHETGKLRGTLCRKCNMNLGVYGDSIEKMERAIAYLRLWKEKHAAE